MLQPKQYSETLQRKKLPNVELLMKLATFGPGTNREPLEGLFSDMGPCEQKASQYLHKCINAYVDLRQLDTFSKLCFSESEAFETKQLANEWVADNTGTVGLPNPLASHCLHHWFSLELYCFFEQYIGSLRCCLSFCSLVASAPHTSPLTPF